MDPNKILTKQLQILKYLIYYHTRITFLN